MGRQRNGRNNNGVIIAGICTIIAAIIGVFNIDLTSCVTKNASNSSSLDSDYNSSSSNSIATSENLNSDNFPQESELDTSLDESQSNPNTDSETTSKGNIENTPPDDSQPDKTYTFYDENGWAKLFDDHSGEAYIYKSFLDANYIGKVEDGYEIVGWGFNLVSYGISRSLHIYKNPGEIAENFNYSAAYLSNGEFINDWSGQISAEYVANGDLKITFNINNTLFDLTDLRCVGAATCVTKVSSNNFD